MEFWGVEVKSGEPFKYDPGFKKYLHLSQASLGEVKKDKGSDSIPLSLEVSGQKLILGTLSPDNCTHISFDLVFEKEFELSHNWKNGSVYFCGYKGAMPEEQPEDFTDTDSEEDNSLLGIENGKSEVKNEKPTPASVKGDVAKIKSALYQQLKEKAGELKKDERDDDSEEEDSDDDEDMVEAEDDSGDDEDEDDESSEEEDEAALKKAEAGKKRPVESASKTPLPEKKAKLVTPSGQKKGADGKKGDHTATPYPPKQAPKTTPSNDKSKPHTPKSGGQVTCQSCSKTFNSEIALQSHTKAKHSAGK